MSAGIVIVVLLLIFALSVTMWRVRRLERRVEDLEDSLAAQAAMAEPGESIPYEQVRRELGL